MARSTRESETRTVMANASHETRSMYSHNRGNAIINPEEIPAESVYFWVIQDTNNIRDHDNLMRMNRKGLTMVPASRHMSASLNSDPLLKAALGSYTEEGTIKDRGRVLMEMRKEQHEAEQRYFSREHQKLLKNAKALQGMHNGIEYEIHQNTTAMFESLNRNMFDHYQ